MNKLYLDHKKINDLHFELIRKINKTNWKPDIIIGLARGGLPSAVYMSHWFEIPMFTAHVSFRDWTENKTIQTIVDAIFENKKILIIDDINDSGVTLKYIYEHVNKLIEENVFKTGQIKTSVLVNNLGSSFTVDFHGMEIDKREQDCWVVFPWESWWNM